MGGGREGEGEGERGNKEGRVREELSMYGARERAMREREALSSLIFLSKSHSLSSSILRDFVWAKFSSLGDTNGRRMERPGVLVCV